MLCIYTSSKNKVLVTILNTFRWYKILNRNDHIQYVENILGIKIIIPKNYIEIE